MLAEGVKTHGPILGKNLAKKLNMSYDSRFRQILANLAKWGVLRRTHDGYQV